MEILSQTQPDRSLSTVLTLRPVFRPSLPITWHPAHVRGAEGPPSRP